MTDEQMISYAKKGEKAARDAFAKLVRERRKTGETLILWKNGKVVEVPAIEIPDSDLNAKPTIP